MEEARQLEGRLAVPSWLRETKNDPSPSLPAQVRYKLETQQQEDLKKEQLLDQQQRVKRIAREMSDLVVYCRPVPFLLEGESPHVQLGNNDIVVNNLRHCYVMH